MKARTRVIMGLERRSLVLDEEERHLVAVHEAGHALVSVLSDQADPIKVATIVPHGSALGMVVRLPEKDRRMVPLARLRSDLIVLMAGRAAEHVVFGEDMITTGAESDIRAATEIARRMVMEWGFSEEFGLVTVTAGTSPDPRIDGEISSITQAAYSRAIDLIHHNRAAHQRIVESLLELETLNGEEIVRLVREGPDGARGCGEDGKSGCAAQPNQGADHLPPVTFGLHTGHKASIHGAN